MHPAHHKRRILRWLIPATIPFLVLVGLGAWTVYPYFSFNEMFRRSRPALDAYATKVMASGPPALTSPPKRLGYFHVYDVEPLPNGFLFRHDEANPFDWSGLAYSTTPLPQEDKDAAGEVKQVFTPLGGNWYDVFRP